MPSTFGFDCVIPDLTDENQYNNNSGKWRLRPRVRTYSTECTSVEEEEEETNNLLDLFRPVALFDHDSESASFNRKSSIISP